MAIVNITASITYYTNASLRSGLKSNIIPLGYWTLTPDENYYVADNSLNFIFGQPGFITEDLQAFDVNQNTNIDLAVLLPHGILFSDSIQNSLAIATLKKEAPELKTDIQQNSFIAAHIVLFGGELLANVTHNTISDTKLSTEGSLPTTHIIQHSSAFGRIFTGTQFSVNAYQNSLGSGLLEAHNINVQGDISQQSYATATVNYSLIFKGVASEASQAIGLLFSEKDIFATIVNLSASSAILFHYKTINALVSQESAQYSRVGFARSAYGVATHYSTAVADINEATRLHVHPTHNSYSISTIGARSTFKVGAVHNTYTDVKIHVIGDAKSATAYLSCVPYAFITQEGHRFIKSFNTRQRTKIARAYLIPSHVPKQYLKTYLLQEAQQESYLSVATRDLLAYNIQVTDTVAYIWTGYHRLLGDLVQKSVTFVVPTKILKKIIVKPRLIYYGEPNLHFIFYDDE